MLSSLPKRDQMQRKVGAVFEYESDEANNIEEDFEKDPRKMIMAANLRSQIDKKLLNGISYKVTM
jgi:hypothetical protein